MSTSHRNHRTARDDVTTSTASSRTSSPTRCRQGSTRTSSARSPAQKEEPEWLLEFRLKAYRAWQDDDGADLAQRALRPIDYQAISYLLGAEEEAVLNCSTRSIPNCGRRSTSSASRSTNRSCMSGVAVDAVFDSVSVATTFRSKLAELGHHLLLVQRGRARAPRAREEVPRLGRAVHRQLLRDAELGGLQRRQLRLHPEGRALPDGAEHLLPHQRGQHGPVRADADRRRRGRVRQLPRRLHGADARREPAARRGRRARRAGRRDDQVLDRPELVSRRRRRQGRHLQLRHQARRRASASTPRSPGRRSRPARRSRGSTRAAC